MVQGYNISLAVHIVHLNTILMFLSLPGDGISLVQIINAADPFEQVTVSFH